MKKINVLAIDDDEISLKLIKLILEKNSFVDTIITATNGLEALEILEKRFDIDLILLDLIMPVMNGYEFLANIQTRDYLSMIPIIVVSTDETAKQKVFEYGAYDFILKPIREKELSSAVQETLNLLA
ncbi:receiver domain protein [Campylobacter iguaniorum]|uniref:response regulator n=1 Tax=Campylobacter iguaniorum TaxID=1244531 RepID=UPI0007C8AAC5|nr:response regulator [Campylobacter iguaniorum]ANE36259.1 receiver domain protein [Campylobacter iguaniorum]